MGAIALSIKDPVMYDTVGRPAIRVHHLKKKLLPKYPHLTHRHEVVIEKPTAKSPTPVHVSGSCDDWIRAAGITDIANARVLIQRESGCNPNAVNASSGACGVAQELPCGKSGCSLGDGACQVRWMNGYVMDRYGSWASAVAWHDSHNWY